MEAGHLQQIAQGVSAVQDILHHDDVLPRDVAGQVLGDLHLAAGGGPAAIGGHRHEVHRTGQIDAPAQVRHEHKGTSEHADQHDLLSDVVPVDLTGDLLHPLGQLFL